MTTSSMRIGVVATVMGILLAAGTVQAGNLDSPAAPTDAGSAMYTVTDLYNRLDTGAAGAKRAGSFVEPSGAPGSTGKTLDEIMAKTPATNANAAVASEVVSGKVYWGLNSGAWGSHTGTRALAPVLKTGQTNSYDESGTLVPSNFDDGDYEGGVAWPSPRFTVGTGATSNCVTDNLTGLMWIKNPGMANRIWTNAIEYCEALDGSDGRGGYTDWRLPNVAELLSLICYANSFPALPSGHPFVSLDTTFGGYHWSSTTYASTKTGAWRVGVEVGVVGFNAKGNGNGVWPVRGP